MPDKGEENVNVMSMGIYDNSVSMDLSSTLQSPRLCKNANIEVDKPTN